MQFFKEISTKKKPNSTLHLSIQQYLFCANLLKNGYPLLDACSLLDVDIPSLKKEIENGKQIHEILMVDTSQLFIRHLRFFFQFMSFADAIDSAYQLHNFEHRLKRQLIKKSMYPIILCVFAFIMLYFFSQNIIPQMLTTFATDTSFQTLATLVSIIRIILQIIFWLTFTTLCITLYLKKHRNLHAKLVWKYRFKIPYICQYLTYLFAGYILAFEQRGIATLQAMQYLKKIKTASAFKYFIDQIDSNLLNGKTFESALMETKVINKKFHLAFNIGNKTNQLCAVMDSYMQQQLTFWETDIKKFAIILQCISYAFVGLVVLLVFQIMLVPLNMLESM